MSRFVKAEAGLKSSVTYIDDSGKKYIYSGGDRTWRNNNPGALVAGDVSKRNGQIGVAGGFAVFPDYESGHNALIDSLLNSHGNKNLEQMIKVYAPKRENNTAKHLRFLRQQTGVKDGKKIKDFSPAEFESLWKAIERMEGKTRGNIRELEEERKKIIGVRKDNKGCISEYLTQDLGWVSKSEGIDLARKKQIDAVVAVSRSGNLYLKSRPDA